MDVVSGLWILLCGFMVLDMQAGFLCLEAGMARAKNASNVAMKNVSDICFATLAFWGLGFGLMFGATHGGLVGTSFFALSEETTLAQIAPFLFFQMAFAATAVTIISGAVAERASFPGYVLMSVAMAGLIYPVMGHAVWGGGVLKDQQGWLQAMGFVDFAGATVVHSVGGWAALVYCVMLGARRGRFGKGKRRFEASSFSQAALGVVLLWIGWTGFNAGSAMAYNEAVAPIIVRTLLGAAAGGATALLFSLFFLRHASATLTLNGVLAGLVAGTGGIHLGSGFEALILGSLGASAMIFASGFLRIVQVDDVVDAISVHLAPGILGTLAVPFVGQAAALPAGGLLPQLGVQALGVVTCAAWAAGATWLFLSLLKTVIPLRVSPRDEVVGLDNSEHNIGNALLDLINHMRAHQVSGQFSTRVKVDPSTDVGLLARSYNKVLERAEEEIEARMTAVRSERMMREMVEESYDALHKAQRENAHAARHDLLTGLGNRMLLDEMIGSPEAASDPYLVVAVDLDRFKAINDRYGHDAGDAVLRAAAERLGTLTRENRDFAFRIGGDEFILFMEWREVSTKAQDFCDMIVSDLSQPVPFGNIDLEPGSSVGFFLHDAGGDIKSSLKYADMALYEAKKAGRGVAFQYSQHIGSIYTAHVDELALFKNALARNEIFAVFQPQVDARSLALVGCEVLARWEHPDRGTVGPGHFLPLADELEMTAELDRLILTQALDAYRELSAICPSIQSISVNVSAKRLADPFLLKELRQLPELPKGLSFEILETAHIDELDADLAVTVAEIKAMGIAIEVDDFGTGHASLASILALRPDALKIDRMFVTDVEKHTERAKLVKTLVELARRFGAKTVVEGIENEAQAKAVTGLGADRLQGYHFGRPMTLEQMREWLQKNDDTSSVA